MTTGLTACTSLSVREDSTNSSGRATKGQSPIPVEGLRPVEVAATLDGDTLVIDLRPEVDPVGGSGIPGATHATVEVLSGWAKGERTNGPATLEPSRRIIVYSSDEIEARSAAEMLRDLGFDRVAYLKGGFDGWTPREAKTATSTNGAENDTRREQ